MDHDEFIVRLVRHERGRTEKEADRRKAKVKRQKLKGN
jgi:hypothetical protein